MYNDEKWTKLGACAMAENRILDAGDDEFLNVISKLLKYVLNEGRYLEKFDNEIAGRLLDSSRLLQTNPQSYQKLDRLCGYKVPYGSRSIRLDPSSQCENNAAFLREAAAEYIRSAEDPKLASGRLVWRVLAKTDFHGVCPEGAGDKQFFRRKAAFEHNKVRFLNSVPLQLGNACKVDILDLFSSYKASDNDGIYGVFFKKLSRYDIGAEPADQNYVAKQTVKLLAKILDKSRGSGGAGKLQLMAPLFENAAKNAFYIDNISYVDVSGSLGEKGKVYTLNRELKQDILKRLKHSNLEFSSECLHFFEAEAVSNSSLQHKMAFVQNMLKMSSRPYERKKAVMDKIHPLIEADMDNPLVKPESLLIGAYAGYLCEYAAFHPEEKGITARRLSRLLEANAEYRGQNAVQGSLFETVSARPQINRELVAAVAKTYADSVITTNSEGMSFNPYFHQDMTRMFAEIVSHHDYPRSEVSKLCLRLERGGGGAREFRNMSRQIMQAYTAASAGKAVYSRRAQRL